VFWRGSRFAVDDRLPPRFFCCRGSEEQFAGMAGEVRRIRPHLVASQMDAGRRWNADTGWRLFPERDRVHRSSVFERQSGGSVYRLRYLSEDVLGRRRESPKRPVHREPFRQGFQRRDLLRDGLLGVHQLRFAVCHSLSQLASRPGVPRRRRSRRAAIGSGRPTGRYHLYAAGEGRRGFSRGARDRCRKKRWKCSCRPRRV